MDKVFKKTLNYIIAFCVSLFIITYLLKIPFYLTNNNPLVNEYYIKNYLFNVPLDFVLVFVYLIVGYIFIRLLKLKTTFKKLITVAVTTGLISFMFMLYFISRPVTNNFFSKWFHSVGYKTIIYDIILLSCVFIVFNYMNKLII
jgi:hypothetical protein